MKQQYSWRMIQQLFTTTFLISAFTFGGGYVIVPLMKKAFVERLNWFDEAEMLDIIAIAQSTPGAIAVNSAVMVGYRVAGLLGAVVTLFATVLPPLCAMMVVSYYYLVFRDNPIVAAVLKGMQAGVAAVIIKAVWDMGRPLFAKNAYRDIVVVVAAFVAAAWLRWHILLVLVVGTALRWLWAYHTTKSKGGAGPPGAERRGR